MESLGLHFIVVCPSWLGAAVRYTESTPGENEERLKICGSLRDGVEMKTDFSGLMDVVDTLKDGESGPAREKKEATIYGVVHIITELFPKVSIFAVYINESVSLYSCFVCVGEHENITQDS